MARETRHKLAKTRARRRPGSQGEADVFQLKPRPPPPPPPPLAAAARFRNCPRLAATNCLLLALILVHSINLCQTALLTNIYGKKLSKLTDISHRYLLLPSQQQHTSTNTGKILLFERQQQELLDSSNQSAPLALNNDDATDAADNLEPLPSPLALTLSLQNSANSNNNNNNNNNAQAPIPRGGSNRPQQQQQMASGGGGKARLLLQAANGSTAGQQGAPNEPPPAGILQQQQQQTGDTSGGGSSTEFPNPNINNLGHEITKILRKFFLHGYDKRVRPNYSGPPALVNVSFHIIGISSVDEVQMDFTTDFYFRQKWFDPRLVFDPVEQDNQTIDELCVGAEFAEKIWLPDTFFANEKTATFHKATTENTFIRIGHNGRVYRSIRLTVTCSCPMDLQYFPMDRQRCKIEIESYGYNAGDIDYRWEKGDQSVTLNTKIELPQFKILGFKMGQELQKLSSGDYIRLYCEIHFVRSMGYYLIQIYIPASLIVMISWVSFWLHRNATPARVALGVTTVLTMTTLMSSTNAALPKISYIKSIDVFLGTCFVMVFASLLEYASVGYIGKRIAMKRKRLQDLQQMQQHHQKVCVAAAASAAAAAAAAQETNPVAVASKLIGGGGGGGVISNTQQQQASLFQQASTISQTLQRARPSQPGELVGPNGSKTLHRTRTSSQSQEENGYGQRSAIKVVLNHNDHYQHGQQVGDPTGKQAAVPASNQLNPAIDNNNNNTNTSASHHHHQQQQQQQNRAPLCAAMVAAINQSPHGPTTEFEVSQTHDTIRICGLTPSAIDKHSRVVFPICFVCFNLMYWIIYGHISQQVEDKGPLDPVHKELGGSKLTTND